MKSSFNTHKRKLNLDVLFQRYKKNIFTFLPEDQIGNKDLATSSIGLILSGIDIPVALALEDKMGKYKIVSQGKPLCAVIQFMNGDFALSETNLFKEISGKNFSDLPNFIVNNVFEYTASISTCLEPASTHDEISELVELFKSVQ
jgi:hypothetical protein